MKTWIDPNATMQAAIDSAPAGMSGLVIAPWDPSEVYGVAADWAQASCPIRSYGHDGWDHTRWQVADFRHRPTEALAAVLAEALIASGDDEDEADALAADAEEF